MNNMKKHLVNYLANIRSGIRSSDNAKGGESKKNNLMTHIVAGYPDFDTNIQVVKIMEKVGVKIIEVQIPHSDPMADGPVIMNANQSALDSGVTVKSCFELLQKITTTVSTPILIMSYYNILYKNGVDSFLKRCKEVGVSGLIIPDIPYDEIRENFFEKVKNYDLVAVPVISPLTSEKRCSEIVKMAKHQGGFIYMTLKTGITGVNSGENQLDKTLEYIRKFKQNYPDIVIAAGFGITNREDIDRLEGLADMSVVGSQVIRLMNERGTDAVEPFLKSLI